MIRKILFFSFFTIISIVLKAQSITAKLQDSESEKPVPYATIQLSETYGVMSNEEGIFEIELPKTLEADSLKITSLGYKTKLLSLRDSISDIILLDPEIFEIAPVILSNKKISVEEIIKKIKENIKINYNTNYTQTEFFLRENYRQRIKNFNFDVDKSSIDNINQTLFDTITAKLPKHFTSLVESYGKTYLYQNKETKTKLEKVLIIQDKYEKASAEKIQNDFFNTLKKNTKPNSYLIIKSGIIRLDKTETIDSILSEVKEIEEKPDEKRKEGIQKYRDIQLKNMMKSLFINEDASVDILNKSGKYEFTKEGYVEIGNDLAYIIKFHPKGKAKYKGILYVNTEDFGIVRAEISGAHAIFDKHFNMLGITANDLTYKSTIIFDKNEDNKYVLKYYKIANSQQAGINRPIKVIEKNKFVKGRRKQNEVSFQMNIQIYNENTRELIFNKTDFLPKSMFENFQPKSNFKVVRKSTYDKHFWDGKNIITPEKAIQELKIE